MQFQITMSHCPYFLQLRFDSGSPYYTVSQKTRDYILYNNFNNKCPITIFFGSQ